MSFCLFSNNVFMFVFIVFFTPICLNNGLSFELPKDASLLFRSIFTIMKTDFETYVPKMLNQEFSSDLSSMEIDDEISRNITNSTEGGVGILPTELLSLSNVSQSNVSQSNVSQSNVSQSNVSQSNVSLSNVSLTNVSFSKVSETGAHITTTPLKSIGEKSSVRTVNITNMLINSSNNDPAAEDDSTLSQLLKKKTFIKDNVSVCNTMSLCSTVNETVLMTDISELGSRKPANNVLDNVETLTNSLNLRSDLQLFETTTSENENTTTPSATIESFEPKLLVPNCGVALLDFRRAKIIGGVVANPRMFPWMVNVLVRQFHICAGTIITETFVLTAAHCLVKSNPRHLAVRSFAGFRRAKNIFVNSGFWMMKNDIGLIELAKPYDHLSPSCISDLPEPPVGTATLILGWGLTYEKGHISDDLLAAEIQILSKSICENGYKGFFHFDMICAGSLTGVPDTCHGDSGGPLLKQIEGIWHQIGIVSFGDGCGRPLTPGVYTRVEPFLPWIKSIVEKNPASDSS